jgi:hypothetical protein
MQFILGSTRASRVPTGALAGRLERAKSNHTVRLVRARSRGGGAPATAPEAGALPIYCQARPPMPLHQLLMAS